MKHNMKTILVTSEQSDSAAREREKGEVGGNQTDYLTLLLTLITSLFFSKHHLFSTFGSFNYIHPTPVIGY